MPWPFWIAVVAFVLLPMMIGGFPRLFGRKLGARILSTVIVVTLGVLALPVLGVIIFFGAMFLASG